MWPVVNLTKEKMEFRLLLKWNKSISFPFQCPLILQQLKTISFNIWPQGLMNKTFCCIRGLYPNPWVAIKLRSSDLSSSVGTPCRYYVSLTPVSWHTPGSPAGSRGTQRSWGVEVWRSARCPGKRCTLVSDWEAGSPNRTLGRACRRNTLLPRRCPRTQTGLSSCTERTRTSLHCQRTWVETKAAVMFPCWAFDTVLLKPNCGHKTWNDVIAVYAAIGFAYLSNLLSFPKPYSVWKGHKTGFHCSCSRFRIFIFSKRQIFKVIPSSTAAIILYMLIYHMFWMHFYSTISNRKLDITDIMCHN